MKTLRSLLLACLVMFLCDVAVGQQESEFTELLSSIEKRYKTLEAYSIKTVYQYSLAEDRKKVLENMDGVIHKGEGNYYSRIDKTETIFIDQSFLKINHNQRAVLYSGFVNGQRPNPLEFSRISDYFCQIDKEVEGDLIRFILHMDPAAKVPYKTIELVVDPITKQLKAQHLLLKPGQQTPSFDPNASTTQEGVISIYFEEFDQPNYPKKIFELDNYLVVSDEVSLAKNFATYRLYQSK